MIFWLALNYFNKRITGTWNSVITNPLTWVTVGLLLFVVLTPSITKDRSCHNPLRGGESSISPVLNFTVDVSMDKWDQTRKIFSTFAKKHNLSFKDSSEHESDAVKLFYVSICRESGLLIQTNEQRWGSNDFAPRAPISEGITVGVYSTSKDDNWQILTSMFIGSLENQLTSEIIFRDHRGREVTRSETKLDQK